MTTGMGGRSREGAALDGSLQPPRAMLDARQLRLQSPGSRLVAGGSEADSQLLQAPAPSLCVEMWPSPPQDGPTLTRDEHGGRAQWGLPPPCLPHRSCSDPLPEQSPGSWVAWPLGMVCRVGG